MTTPQEIIVSKLRGGKRNFSFDLGQRGTATLQYENWFCSKAVGSINDRKWNFRRKGFWKKQLDIVAQQSPYTKTHIDLSWKQRLSVYAGNNHLYHFKPIGFWRKSWGWFDSGGQKLIEMKSSRLSRKRRGIITVFQPAMQESYWLMLVGWFQLMAWEDQAAAAAVS